ncbi:hypothetical protein Tco_1174652 [Tanacetum coccineum]
MAHRGCLVWAPRIKYSKILAQEIGYDVSDLLDTAYRTYSVRRIDLLRYGVLVSLGTAYWLFGYGVLSYSGTMYCISWVRRIELLRYGVLAESVFFLIFNQSIIYDVNTDVDTAYSSKSGNGLEFFNVLDTSYRSRIIRRISCQISRLSRTLRLCSKMRTF